MRNDDNKVKKSFIKFFNSIFSSVIDLKNQSIKIKLISGFLLMIIPIIFVAFLLQSASIKIIKDKTMETSILAMNQSSKYINSVLSNTSDISTQIITQINTNDKLRHYLTREINDIENFNEDITKNELEKMLTSYIETRNSISKIVLISENHDSIGVGNSGVGSFFEVNLNMSKIKQSQWYKEAIKNDGKVIWVGKHSEIDNSFSQGNINTYSISCVRAIKSSTPGKYSGILIIDVDYKLIENLLNEINQTNNSEVHFISPDGRSIYSKSVSNINTVHNEFEEQKYSFIEKITNNTKTSDANSINYNNNDYLLVYSKLDNINYVLAGLLSAKEVLSSITSTINFIVTIIVIIATLIAILISYVLADSVSKDINKTVKKISVGAGQAADGNLTTQIEIDRKDELGVLTKSINAMITNMKSLILQVFNISNKVSEYSNNVTGISDESTTSSQTIAFSIQEIALGANNQALLARECFDKMNDLTSKINNVTSNVKVIKESSIDTMNTTKQGLSNIEDLNNKTSETEKITQTILDDINLLDEKSKSISNIVNVINQIAEQTNLLSLNASIEAARAGEHGRGFAVVAQEVRNLAEQSRNSAKEISNIVNATQRQTAQTVQRAYSAGEIVKSQNKSVIETISIFNKITSYMSELVDKVEAIEVHVDEMDSNKQNVVTAINSILDFTQQTVSSTQEVSATTEEQLASLEELNTIAQELNSFTQQLNVAVNKFKVY